MKVDVFKLEPKQTCFSSTLCQRPELGRESLQYLIYLIYTLLYFYIMRDVSTTVLLQSSAYKRQRFVGGQDKDFKVNNFMNIGRYLLVDSLGRALVQMQMSTYRTTDLVNTHFAPPDYERREKRGIGTYLFYNDSFYFFFYR